MRAAIAVIALAACGSASAKDPAFNFTPAQFMAMYNNRIVDHASDDSILSIQKGSGDAEAKLGQAAFQRGVKMMKDMDLMNGRVTMDIRIIFALDAAGHVTIITIEGTRGDPINMMRTIGVVGAVYEILNPGWTEDTERTFLVPLGLMRGDADPTIGQPMGNFSKGGAFTCNSQPSGKTLAFGCFIVPRS